MIEYLRIIAGSWPIACTVIGISTAITIRRTLRQAMDNSRDAREYRASQAVVVRGRED